MRMNPNSLRGKEVSEIVYDQYQFSLKDWLEYVVYCLVKSIIICYLFYDSYKAFIIMIPFVVMDYKTMKIQKKEQQKNMLTQQFKSLIESLSTALSAGYSLEKAFEESKKDIRLIYPEKAIIFRELEVIFAGLKMNVPIEQLLQNFGNRSGIDDITNFANVVAVAKRSGGNLIHIIQKTGNSIADKMAVEEEIKTMITAKKYEEKIMMIMPYGIILYLRLSNEGYFDVLYHNLLGIGLMTIFLIVIYVADIWAQKIMEIRV